MSDKEIYQQVVGIDVARFLSALLVAFFHLGYWGGFTDYSTTAWALKDVAKHFLISPTFQYGWVGVQIFFVISGFVIAYSANSQSALAFAKSRIARLYPAVIVCACITMALLIIGDASPAPPMKRFIKTIILFPKGPWIDGVYWTLSVEITFYLLVFILLLTNMFRHIETVMTLVGLMSVTAALIIHFSYPQGFDMVDGTVANLTLFANGSCFAIGVFIWLSSKSKWSWRRIALCTAFAAGALIFIFHKGSFVASAMFLLGLLLVGLAVRFNNRTLAILPASVVRVSRTVGLATFPIYLLHNDCGATLMRFLFYLRFSPTTCLLIIILAVVFVSILISLIVEPVLRKPIARSFEAVFEMFPYVLRQKMATSANPAS